MQLARALGLPDCKEYLDTIMYKVLRFGYHADKEKEAWQSLSAGGASINVASDAFGKAMFAAETHVESAAQVLHSQADIVGQVINQVVLGGMMRERRVSIHSVGIELRKDPVTAPLTTGVDRLVQSPEFDYVESLVNTIKHRRILRSDFRIAMGPGTPGRFGLQLRAFTYDTKSFPELWVDDLIGQYEPRLRGYITDIGLELNAHLRRKLPPEWQPPP